MLGSGNQKPDIIGKKVIALFENSHRIYGIRRVKKALEKEGVVTKFIFIIQFAFLCYGTSR
jgi:hypothetical protein